MILEGLKLQLAAAAAIALVVLCSSLTVWALLERARRLECKAELVRAADQVDVLAGSLKRQNAALEALRLATAGVVDRTGRILGQLEAAAAGDRKTIASLRGQLQGKTPPRVDGSAKDCTDYLKEWRAEP